MRTIVIEKQMGRDVKTIWGADFTIRSPHGEKRRRLSGPKDLARVLAQEFGVVDVPVDRLVSIVEENAGISLFAANRRHPERSKGSQ